MIKGAIERATNPQQEFGDIALRYDLLALNAVLFADSSSAARLETDASQFEDVVSQVVVYSNEQAKPLRSLAK